VLRRRRRIALVIGEHRLAVRRDAFRSGEIGESITEAKDTELDERLEILRATARGTHRTARGAPKTQTSLTASTVVRRDAAGPERLRCGRPERSSSLAISRLPLRVEENPHVCSTSRSVV